MDRSEGQAVLAGAGRAAPAPLTLKARRPPDAAVANSDQPVLDWLDRRLIDAYQRGFPVCEKPFAEIASRLHCRANEVLGRLADLQRRGVVRRTGPVFAPGWIGASTLAAMAVPQARLDSVAEWVNRYRAVGQSCEREHEFNLWFVLTTPNAGELYETIADIRRRTGLDVLDLREERVYDIGLELPRWPRQPSRHCPAPRGVRSHERGPKLDAFDRRLAEAVRDGLPLTARPYAELAARIGHSEAQVMERLRRLLCEGVIARMGVVVRHHELGYHANAMVVLDVPRARADIVGERLARVSRVVLRTRRPPVWSYNLHCMLRGRNRDEVGDRVDEVLSCAVGGFRRTVLFSRRRFLEHDARYAPDDALLQ